MITKLLVDRVNYQAEVESLKQEWLHDLLIYLGADTDWLQGAPRDLAVEYLIQNNLTITRHAGLEACEVSYEGEVVGEWGGPELTLKEDEDGKLYFEIEIEHWSIMEDEIEE